MKTPCRLQKQRCYSILTRCQSNKKYDESSDDILISTSDLHETFPDRIRTLMISAISSTFHASYRLPVRRANALLWTSFRFRLAADTLAQSLQPSPCRAASGLSPVSRAPCRAHRKNAAITMDRGGTKELKMSVIRTFGRAGMAGSRHRFRSLCSSSTDFGKSR